MKNSNIIISVIIVLCIAGGVTAYSLTNPEGGISNILSYTLTDDSDFIDGSTGNNGVNNGNSSNSGKSLSNGNGGSSNRQNPSNSNSGNPSNGRMTASQAKTIAQNAIKESGTYAGTPYWNKSMQMWVVKVHDKNGNVLDGIGVDSNGHTNRV